MAPNAPMGGFRNPFTESGNWYKANFHTHTTTSDGRKTPQEIVSLYRRKGYHVLALTDHGKTNDVARLSSREFLVINGMEYHPPVSGGCNNHHHLVALNVPRHFAFKPDVAKDAHACIRAVKAAGGETILAHPYWSQLRYDHCSDLGGIIAVEVYNAISENIGRAYSETDWSQMLDAGWILPAVAVDDTHRVTDDALRGWVWLKMKRLSAANVMRALRTGCFFSSVGPRIMDLRFEGDTLRIECSPARRIYVVSHGLPIGEVGARFEAQEGKSLRSAGYKLPLRLPKVLRVVVEDHQGRKAWSNPLVIGERHLAAVRRAMRQVRAANWAETYPWLLRAGNGQWHPLKLASVANRPLCGRDAWIGDGTPMNRLAPGTRRIHGVPFRIPTCSRIPGANAAIALASRRLCASGGAATSPFITIPVGRDCRAVYFLQGVGFSACHEKLADYEFVFDDDQVVVEEILARGTAATEPERALELDRKAALQDWWFQYRHFDNERARKVVVTNPADPCDHRFLYTLQWINPRPDGVLKAIRLRGNPASDAILIVLGVTILQGKGTEGTHSR